MIAYMSLFAALLCGCSGGDIVSHSQVDVTISMNHETRAVVSDRNISSLDVLAFRAETGVLDSHVRVFADQVTFQVTGEIEIFWFVAANAPEGTFDDVTDVDGLSSVVYRLDSFVDVPMSTSGVDTFHGGETMVVSFDRLLSRVVLDTVIPSFLASGFEDSAVTLDAVYLINVNGTVPFLAAAAAGDVWYNRSGRETLASPLSGLLVTDAGVSLDGNAVSGPWVFYCCPNPVDNDIVTTDGGQWLPRNTRLVVEVSIDGVRNYYPVTLPAMECNVSYTISNLVLLGPGSSSPDVPPSRNVLSFTVSVNPWLSDATDLVL